MSEGCTMIAIAASRGFAHMDIDFKPAGGGIESEQVTGFESKWLAPTGHGEQLAFVQERSAIEADLVELGTEAIKVVSPDLAAGLSVEAYQGCGHKGLVRAACDFPIE